MIRSGGEGSALKQFAEGNVGIGFGTPEDLTGKNLTQIRALYRKFRPNDSIYRVGGAVGMLDKIVNVIQRGDGVATYDPESRSYWLGTIESDYYFANKDEHLPHRRKVNWDAKKVSRDDLSLAARNSLGSTLTLFSLPKELWSEMIAAQCGQKLVPEELTKAAKIEAQQDKRNLIEQARERLKDRIVELDDEDMQELLAAVLRAMGFKTRVSAKGPDRGIDVLASPDGLGLQQPRIKAEVKHRKNTQMGSPEVRSLIATLRAGDTGIYLSTGGFSKEARYEAERSDHPVTLMDLDELARLIETHYNAFDAEGQGLLPLTRIYWPAD